MTDSNNIPASVFSKMLTLSDAAEYCSEKVISTEQGIASARQRLTGGFQKQAEYEDLRSTLQTMVDDLPVLKRRAAAAQSIYRSCKSWVDQLPKATVLEPVTVNVDGQSLDEVRARIAAVQSELATLRSLPTSSADIRQRVESYVDSLARPRISGIGPNETLGVVWGGAGWDRAGDRKDRADPLALAALLHRDKMVDALMAEIDRMTSGVVPIKERGPRIAALTDEIEQLGYVEEALVAAAIANGEDVQGSPKAPPQAVLGIRVVEAVTKPRAA
jgi:uncharacterized small protein (DUF1192 family)